MWPSVAWFLLGAVTPMVIERAKPLARGIRKRGALLTNHIQRTAHELREDIQDVMAEAAAAVNGQAEQAVEGETQYASSDLLWRRTRNGVAPSRQEIVPIPTEDVVDR